MRKPWFIETAPHEASGYLNYDTGDFELFAALERADATADDSSLTTFRYNDRAFTVELSNKATGLDTEHAPRTLLRDGIKTGQPVVPGYVLQLQPTDGIGGKDDDTRSFTVEPRWPEMDTAYTPDYVGLSVEFNGVNEPLDAYPELFEQALTALDVTTESLRLASGWITTFDRYVRATTSATQPLVCDDGVFDAIEATVAVTDGVAKMTRDDRGVEGAHRALTLSSRGAAALIDGHVLGKRLKHYHPKFPRVTDATTIDPLANPKVCVTFQKSHTDADAAWLSENGAVQWVNRDRLVKELEETLLSTLAAGDIPVREDVDVYVPDHYFSATESARDRQLTTDLTDTLYDEQTTGVEAALALEYRPEVDYDVMGTLAENGEMTVETVAVDAGCSERSVYRVAERNPWVRIRDRVVKFRTRIIRATIRGLRERFGQLRAVRETTDATDETDFDSIASSRHSSFAEWTQQWGASVDTSQHQLRIDLGRLPPDVDPDEILREGQWAWLNDGNEQRRFAIATAMYQRPSGQQVVRTKLGR